MAVPKSEMVGAYQRPSMRLLAYDSSAQLPLATPLPNSKLALMCELAWQHMHKMRELWPLGNFVLCCTRANPCLIESDRGFPYVDGPVWQEFSEVMRGLALAAICPACLCRP